MTDATTPAEQPATQPESRTITITRAHHLQAEHDTAPVSSTLGMAITVVSLLLLLWRVVTGGGGLLVISVQVGGVAVIVGLVNLVIWLINRPAQQRVARYLPEGGEVTIIESGHELLLTTPGGELRYDLTATRGRPLKATLRMEPIKGDKLAIPRGLLTRTFQRRFD